MIRLSDTVKHLLIINVLAFLLIHFALPNILPQQTINSYTALYSLDTGKFNPVQIVTSFFNHADFRHLLFNMMGLIFLGPMVEQSLGPKRFLTLYLAAGVAGSIVSMFLASGMSVGASAAVYAVVVAFAAMYPNMKLMLLFPPIPMKAKYLVGAILAYDILFGFGGVNSGIGHFAHLAGALVGFLLIWQWDKFNLR